MRKSHIPDVALAAFSSGSTQISLCSLTHQALPAEAIFEAASLGKPVFAAAVLTLVQQGKLNLDAPLSGYLREPYRHSRNPFHPDAPSDPVADARLEHVTARMVLSHTTGLPNWDRSATLHFDAEPRARWGYSGEAYLYLQKAVETISGEPLSTFVGDAVFIPVGMTHSSFVWRQAYATTALSGHNRDGRAEPIAQYSRALAPSTLYTTIGDYARFAAALLARRPGSVYAMEQTSQVLVRKDLRLAWGLGVGIEDTTGSVFHWGANPGFQSFVFLTPATDQGILFLTDSDAGLDLVDVLVKAYDPGRHPALKFPMLHPKD